MNNDFVSLYSAAHLYDLVMGAYATEDYLNFYRRQVARYDEPVLELACCSGRFTIPLTKEGVHITGVDISKDMLDLAKLKASREEANVRFLQGDMQSFDLGEKFKFIIIPIHSLIQEIFHNVRKIKTT
jgi:2-polyprenyl-3-methyl-5-hydroxy-6-metoxy-1,4-benzoquinol methylase